MGDMSRLFEELRKTRGEVLDESCHKDESDEDVTEVATVDDIVDDDDEDIDVEVTDDEDDTENEEEDVNRTYTYDELVSEMEDEDYSYSDYMNENDGETYSVLFCDVCGNPVSGYMNESELDECPCCGSNVLVEKQVKVMRDGKVVKKTVKTRKKRLSSKQKAALAKARKRAHTAAANKQRNKSLKKGRAKGLYDEDELNCECGFSGDIDEFVVDEDGNLVCPECGAIVTPNNEADDVDDDVMSDDEFDDAEWPDDEDDDTNESMTVGEMRDMLESLDAPTVVHNALDDGNYRFVSSYIDKKLNE